MTAEIADALARLRHGEPAALLVELDPKTRSAQALPALRTAARSAGFRVVTVPSAESDQVSARSRLLEALTGQGTDGRAITDRVAERLDAMTQRGPVVVIVEDAEWSDPASLVALRAAARLVPHLPVLWAVGVLPAGTRARRVAEALRRLGAVTLTADRTGPQPPGRAPVALLQVGSVIGIEFELDVAASVLGRTVGSLLGEIGNAVTSGVLTDTGSALRFTDARLREQIYRALPPSARKALHYEVAQQLMGPGTEAEAVWHLTRSSSRLTGADLDVVRRAVGRLATVAPEDAAELAARVARLFKEADPRHLEFLTTAAEHLGNTSRVGEALAMLGGVRAGGLSDRQEARLRLVVAHLHQAAGDDTEAMAQVRAALALPGVDPELRLALVKTQAVAHLNVGETTAAERLTRPILRSARHSPDPATKVSADLFASQLAFAQGKVTSALKLAEQAVSGAEVSATRPLPAPRIPELWLATVLLSSDRADEAPELLLAGQRHSEQRGLVWSIPYWHTARAIERWTRGELDDAAAEAETGLHVAERLEITRSRPQTRSVLAMVETDRGNTARARELLAGATLPARPRTYDIWTAAAVLRLGSTDATDPTDGTDPTDTDVVGWLDRHANVGRLMTLPPRVWPSLVSPRAGTVLAALEEIAAAAPEQRTVVTAVEAAKSATREPRPRPRAPGHAAWGWQSLTVSELRVARLVAEGHTNRAIAEQLRVSVHTVGTHLRHAFTKLDINTRVELTRLAVHHGVVRDDRR